MTRRDWMTGVAAVALFPAGAGQAGDPGRGGVDIPRFEHQWRARLTPDEYRIMREGYNETAGTSALARERRAGRYSCRGCGLEVYRSEDKLADGSGWPAFRKPLSGRVVERRDWTFFGLGRTVGCSRCGSHLGVVRADGTPPLGRRHRLNGTALIFRPA